MRWPFRKKTPKCVHDWTLLDSQWLFKNDKFHEGPRPLSHYINDSMITLKFWRCSVCGEDKQTTENNWTPGGHAVAVRIYK